MPEVTPFVAASPGALRHLLPDPNFQKLLKQGIFKDIWGSEFAGFMGFDYEGASQTGELLDNPQGRNTAFTADVSVYRCVDIRGAAIASVPLKIYDQQDPATRKEVQHEALGVLQQTNPSNWVAGPDLLRYSIGSRDLHGNFAWSIAFDQGGRLRNPLPRELYWLPPAQYKPVSGADLDPPQPKVPFAGLKVRRKTKSGSGETFLPANQVVYAPTFSPTGDLRGTSKISALRMDLNLRIAGQNSNWWFFSNNQRPDVVVTGAFSPTVENVSLMRRIWKAAFGGDQARGPAFLPQDMKVQLLTMASKDAEWLGQRHAAREDILASFGVPPPVYGDLSRATYENIRSAYEGFWRQTMIADMDQMAAVLTMQFLRRWPDAARNQLWLAFDYSQIEALQEDANAIWERVGALMQRLNEAVNLRWVLPNQARQVGQALFKMMGLPDVPFSGQVPGGDMFYIPIQQVPILEASVQANIDFQAARAGTTNGETNKPGNGKWVLPSGPPAPAPLPGGPAGPGATPGGPPAAPPPPQPALPKSHDSVLKAYRPLAADTAAIAANVAELVQEGLPLAQAITKAAERFGLAYSEVEYAVDEVSYALRLRPSVTKNRGDREALPAPGVGAGPPDALRAQDWLTRRLKRHFQDQQTAALRALRQAQDAQNGVEAMPEPSDLLDGHAGRESAAGLVSAALEMAGVSAAAADDWARAIEGETASHVQVALGSPGVVTDLVRAAFRFAIEERAADIAAEVIRPAKESAA